MRGGICSIQLQALTPEAASVVKQAVSLATRRGHAQVTPLHVASAMLTSSSGLLRRACLHCHSHPLQCKALELCFNVALNRLPASTPTPLLGPHYTTTTTTTTTTNNLIGISSNTTPSLSNALVAAFKRAQSHQRRGSIEAQNQSILALKIEVEQLVISILDDPSVSRVMREAGFSSTIVKSKVEQSVSIDQLATTTTTTTTNKPNKPLPSNSPFEPSFKPKPKDITTNYDGDDDDDDVARVVSLVLKRRRNVVVVGESVGSAEGLARGVMERVAAGGNGNNNVQVVSVPLVCFRNIRKEEVERKIVELRCVVKSHVGRGIVLYLGDLEWLVEMISTTTTMMMMMNKCYSSVEHMVMEVKRLVSESDHRVCLMGVSSFKTYINCKTCQPSLETLWDLHPFTIPVPILTLSLNIYSDHLKSTQHRWFEDRGVRKNLTCCRDCTVNFEREAQSIITINSMAKKDYCTAIVSSSSSSSTSSTLPSWLQNYQESERLKDLCKKWNSFCNSVHRQPQYLISPSSASKLKLCEQREEEEDDVVCYESSSNNLIMFMPEPDSNTKPDLLSNPNSSPNSASSSEANLDGLDSTHVFKDLNEENLRILCDALEKKVGPQFKHVVHEISSTVLHCRSEKTKTTKKKNDSKSSSSSSPRQDTWMVFSCDEEEGERSSESVSRELAKAVFGSYTNFVMMMINSTFCSSSDHNDHDDDDDGDVKKKNKKKKKRVRNDDENGGSNYVERFGEALNENPHRVFFMEDLEGIDGFSQKCIKEAIQSGSLRFNGEMVPLKDAIVIFSCERDINGIGTSPALLHKKKKNNKDDDDNSLCLDLNIAIEDGECNFLELVDKHIVFKTQEGDNDNN